MINIHIKEKGELKGMSFRGHADYAEHGKDIVCASVSTIFQLAIMGLRVLEQQYPSHIKIKEDDNE